MLELYGGGWWWWWGVGVSLILKKLKICKLQEAVCKTHFLYLYLLTFMCCSNNHLQHHIFIQLDL